MKRTFFALIALTVGVSMICGCATVRRAKEADDLESKVTELQNKLSRLERQKSDELARAKANLEQSLQKELGEYKAKLEMTERGLVITFLAEVFFDSGKDVIKDDGKAALGKVAEVLNSDVPDSAVAVEGHTDSDPIKYSGWKSNWELSSARALAVVHYLVDQGEVASPRLSANAYGEHHPVAANDTPRGKQENRRVEIVILPATLKKSKAADTAE